MGLVHNIIAQVLLLATLIVSLDTFVNHKHRGPALAPPPLISEEATDQWFHHPVYMVLAYGFFMPQAIVAFRTWTFLSRPIRKAVHGVFHLTALILACIGVNLIFKFHNAVQIDNMYSLHSYLGIGAVSIMGFQWLVSALAFGFGVLGENAAKMLIKSHVVFGVAILMLTTMAITTGILDRQRIYLDTQHEDGTPVYFGNFAIESRMLVFTGCMVALSNLWVGITVSFPKESGKPSDGETSALLYQA